MMDLAPLLLLWAIGGGKKRSAASVPEWPTAVSPPPPFPMPLPIPMPQGTPPPGAQMLDAYTGLPVATPQHPAESPATPLSELLKQADALHNVHAAASQAVSKAKAKAVSKAKRKGKSLLKGVLHAPSVGPPAPAQENVSVASLQSAMNRHGAKLKPDGLYGPKTAKAWQELANANQLSPIIKRVGPKTARVANHTYDVLAVPAIP